MRRSTQAAVGCLVAALVLLGGGAVALVRTGAVDAMLSECTDAATGAADEVADAVRRDLSGRTSPVEVEGWCQQQPWPSVTTTTGGDRAVIARELRARWGCTYAPVVAPSLSNGATSPPWECTDVAGYAAVVELDRDGTFVADILTRS